MRTTSHDGPAEEQSARALSVFIVGALDEGARDALRAEGVDLLFSPTGSEVLSALAAGIRPDVTLLDMREPEAMDRAILAALQTEELEAVPVVLLSEIEETREDPRASLYVVRSIEPARILEIARRARSAIAAASAEHAREDSRDPPSGARARSRVLIIDDDADHRDSIRETLLDAGYNVATAIHGRDALAKTIAFRPELILLDMMMPVLDGWGFAEELQRTPSHAAIPIVVLSSGSHALFAAAPRAAGYLRKPLDIAELLRTVRECLGKAAPRPASDPGSRR